MIDRVFDEERLASEHQSLVLIGIGGVECAPTQRMPKEQGLIDQRSQGMEIGFQGRLGRHHARLWGHPDDQFWRHVVRCAEHGRKQDFRTCLDQTVTIDQRRGTGSGIDQQVIG